LLHATGSFAVGDADYARNHQSDGTTGEWGGKGSQALWVLTEVRLGAALVLVCLTAPC